MVIYQILNNINNKSYIGKSKDYLKRYETHLKNARNRTNRYLYDAINHYGVENFSLIVLEECSEECVNERERHWILLMNTLKPNGYNMTTRRRPGGNTLSLWSDEEKRRLWDRQSVSRKGQKRSEKSKTLMSEKAKGRTINQEQRDAISVTLKRRYANKEIVAITPKLYGKDHPQYVDIDIDEVLFKIKSCWTLTKIAEFYHTSSVTVGSRLKSQTGKTFLDWRNHYGIIGRLSNPRLGSRVGCLRSLRRH